MIDQCNKTLVLGIGNQLLRDDAAGPLVIEALRQLQSQDPALRDVTLLDGGTLGLALLPDIDRCRPLRRRARHRVRL
jgi:hydrogenase maturation protease